MSHESDFAKGGVVGRSSSSVEHIVPQSVAPDRAHDYGNCVYCCLKCNMHRGITTDVELLDPTQDAWSSHFRWNGDELVGTTTRGQRTVAAYQSNTEQNKEARATRRTVISKRQEEIQRLTEKLGAAVAQVAVVAHDTKHTIWDGIDAMRKLRDKSIAELQEYAAIPNDHPTKCNCNEPRRLPDWLAAQTQHVNIGTNLR